MQDVDVDIHAVHYPMAKPTNTVYQPCRIQVGGAGCVGRTTALCLCWRRTELVIGGPIRESNSVCRPDKWGVPR